MKTMRLYEPGKLYNYPHVYGEDKLLLDCFWDSNTMHFKKIAYDVAIQGFFNFDKSTNEMMNKNWDYLASFKIDMIGFTNLSTYIIELKHSSKPEAIGQLLVYKHLLSKQIYKSTNVKLMLVTFQLKPVIKEVCELYDIETILVARPKRNILVNTKPIVITPLNPIEM